MVLPYLKTKVGRLYENYVINNEQPPIPISRNVIQFFQSVIDVSFDGINIMFNFLYVIGLSR